MMASELPAVLTHELMVRLAMNTWAVASYMRRRDLVSRTGFASVYDSWQQAQADAEWCVTGIRTMAVRLMVLIMRAQGRRAPAGQLALRQRRSQLR